MTDNKSNEKAIKAWFDEVANEESGTHPFAATVNVDPTSSGGHPALDLTIKKAGK